MNKYEKLFDIDMTIQNIFGHLITFINLFKYKDARELLRRNKEIKNSNKVDTCYILGTGPSLKNVVLEELDGDTIAVNHYIKFDQGKYEPTYYYATDSFFYFEKGLNELAQTRDTYTNTIMLLNGKYRSNVKKTFLDESRVYYEFNGNGIINKKMKVDFSKWIPASINVVTGAILWAIYLGYKRIVLLGCDFNSFASLRPVHCYDESDKREITLSYELFCYSFAAKNHMDLAVYAMNNHIQIYNGTPNSLIDAYERISVLDTKLS